MNLPTLIELKLAAGRSKDFGDVIALIRVRGLSESFLGKLHSFVRGTFVECLEARRREDEDEARLDEAFEDLLRQAQDSRK